MPPFRTPGSISADKGPSVADGTLIRTNSSVPSELGDTGSSLYHEYTHTTVLCRSSEMSLDAVFTLMLSSAKYIAPTDETAPVTDGMTVNVNIGAWGMVISRNNPIRVTVNQGNHSVVNTTLPGHMLYPGTVTRQLKEERGNIVLHTKGVGSGVVQGSLNYIFCSPLLDHLLPRQDTPSGAANNVAAAIVWVQSMRASKNEYTTATASRAGAAALGAEEQPAGGSNRPITANVVVGFAGTISFGGVSFQAGK